MEGKMKEGDGNMDIADVWLKKHQLQYTGATRHPFILSIRDGSVNLSFFKRWLEQDYVFVRAYVPIVASILMKASKESNDPCDMEIILGGLAYFVDELAWFKKEAAKWNVPLSGIVPSKENVEYIGFLESIMSSEVEFTVASIAIWAIEAVYHDSFAYCLEEGNKTPLELKETCQRWGNNSFAEYCHSLKEIANRRLLKASEDVRAKAEVMFLSVLEREIDFWNMSHAES